MFSILFPIRFLHVTALLLAVGILAFAGCRLLSKDSSPLAPVQTSPVQSVMPAPSSVSQSSASSAIIDSVTGESDRHSAFRPIMQKEIVQRGVIQGEYIPPVPFPLGSHQPESRIEYHVSKQPAEVLQNETTPSKTAEVTPSAEPESPSVTEYQSKIDELNRKVEDLESQLDEAKKTPPPIPQTFPEEFPESSSVADLPEAEGQKPASFISLPVINKPDVSVFRDDLQNVRIEIPDKALFLSNAWQLSAEGEETLRTVAAEIKAADAKASLDIEGHTDNLMGDPDNQMQKHDISSEKTKAVMDFFVNSLCWDTSRIRTSSFGRSRPKSDNGTPEGRAKNNRIEIVVRSE